MNRIKLADNLREEFEWFNEIDILDGDKSWESLNVTHGLAAETLVTSEAIQNIFEQDLVKVQVSSIKNRLLEQMLLCEPPYAVVRSRLTIEPANDGMKFIGEIGIMDLEIEHVEMEKLRIPSGFQILERGLEAKYESD